MSDSKADQTEQAPIEVGALARIIRDSGKDSPVKYRAGSMVVIEDFVSAAVAENGQAFYWASTHMTGNINDVTPLAADVELVKTKAEMEGRTLPTREALLDLVALSMHNDALDFAVQQTNQDTAANTVECYGMTDDGLAFVFNVTVGPARPADH